MIFSFPREGVSRSSKALKSSASADDGLLGIGIHQAEVFPWGKIDHLPTVGELPVEDFLVINAHAGWKLRGDFG